MNILEVMKQNQSYCSDHRDMPSKLQQKAKQLCWEYNKTSPKEGEKRAEILKQLFGDCHPLTFIEPSFRCDYGLNIHTYGLTVINYNCVILDTSPVHIGKMRLLHLEFVLPAQGIRLMQNSEPMGLELQVLLP